jgi:hypothetical protein
MSMSWSPSVVLGTAGPSCHWFNPFVYNGHRQQLPVCLAQDLSQAEGRAVVAELPNDRVVLANKIFQPGEMTSPLRSMYMHQGTTDTFLWVGFHPPLGYW